MLSSPLYKLTTPRLGLRRWLPSDLEPFAQMNQDPAVREFFPGLLTYDETKEMVESLEHHFDQYGYGFYAMDLLETGEFLGFTGLSHPSLDAWFTPCVEIGWRLKKEAWNRGVCDGSGIGLPAAWLGCIGAVEDLCLYGCVERQIGASDAKDRDEEGERLRASEDSAGASFTAACGV